MTVSMKKISFLLLVLCVSFEIRVIGAIQHDLSFIHQVQANQNLYNNGKLSEETLPQFLALAFHDKQQQFPQFSSASCLTATNMEGQGGFFTKQLFSVVSTCEGEPKYYIVKEPVKGIEESTRLKSISNVSVLKDLILPNLVLNKPSIAAPIAYLSYKPDNNVEHYLLVMPRAAGKMLCDVINDYKSSPNNQDIIRAYRQLGLEMANFHNLLVANEALEKPLLKDSIIHGDLKCLNIFYDHKTNHFTLIDNESMYFSIERPQSRLIDIAKVLFGNFVKGDSPKVVNVLNGLDLKVWYDLSAKSFFEGYVSAFPKNQQSEALGELRALINRPFPSNYNQQSINDIRLKYLNPIFDELALQSAPTN